MCQSPGNIGHYDSLWCQRATQNRFFWVNGKEGIDVNYLALVLVIKAKIQVLSLGLDTSSPCPRPSDLSPWPWAWLLRLLNACILVVPANSSPAERVFSKSGLIVRPHRAKMSDKLFESSVFATFPLCVNILWPLLALIVAIDLDISSPWLCINHQKFIMQSINIINDKLVNTRWI